MKYQVTFYLFIRKCGSFAKMPQKDLLKLQAQLDGPISS